MDRQPTRSRKIDCLMLRSYKSNSDRCINTNACALTERASLRIRQSPHLSSNLSGPHGTSDYCTTSWSGMYIPMLHAIDIDWLYRPTIVESHCLVLLCLRGLCCFGFLEQFHKKECNLPLLDYISLSEPCPLSYFKDRHHYNAYFRL